MDLRGVDTRHDELLARCLPAVEQPVPGPRLSRKPPGKSIREAGAVERVANVFADLISGSADGRTERNDQIGRTRAKLLRQRGHCDARHSGCQSTPAGMRSRDGT